MRELGIASDSESGGAHTSRTIMLRELRRLLAACPPQATPDDLAAAILAENVLGKRSDSTRKRSLRYLRELYVLDRRSPFDFGRGMPARWALVEARHQMCIGLSSRIMARTTIDIDAAVLRELKKRQKREGKTLGRLVSELLAGALGQSQEPAPLPFAWTSKSMKARVDLEDKEAVRRALEES